MKSNLLWYEVEYISKIVSALPGVKKCFVPFCKKSDTRILLMVETCPRLNDWTTPQYEFFVNGLLDTLNANATVTMVGCSYINDRFTITIAKNK